MVFEYAQTLKLTKNEGLEIDLLTFTLLAYTGLRIGELVDFTWSDIDFDAHTLRVIKTYYNAGNAKNIKKEAFTRFNNLMESFSNTIYD